MIEEIATVIAIQGNKITVKSTIKSTCHTCHQQEECGSGQIAKAIPHKALTTELENHNPHLRVGDEVVIGLSEKSLMSSALQVYLLPLMGLIICASIGQFLVVEKLFMHELMALVLALVGGVFGFLIAKKRQQDLSVQANLQPKLLRKCADIITVSEQN